jgi:hypothetical protein
VDDATLQRALDKNPEGRIAAHATRRIGGSLAESGRQQARQRSVPEAMIARAAKSVPRSIRKEAEAAIRLASENSTATEARDFHLAQAEKGVARDANLKQADLYQRVHDLGLLTKDKAGNVTINAAKHPHVAELDARVATAQHHVDQVLAEHEIMTPAQIEARINAPNRFRAGAQYESPTSAKLGKPSAAFASARARVDRLQVLHDRALEREAAKPSLVGPPHSESGARAELAKLEAQHEALVGQVASKLGGDLPTDPVQRAAVVKAAAAETRLRNRLRSTGNREKLDTASSSANLARQESPYGLEGNLNAVKAAGGLHVPTLKEEFAQHVANQFETAIARLEAEGHPAGAHYRQLTNKIEKLQKGLAGTQDIRGGVDSPRGMFGREPTTRERSARLAVNPETAAARSLTDSPTVQRLGGALSVAKDKLATMEKAAAGRVKPVGVVGGEGARPGRGFVTYKTFEPKAGGSPVAGSPGAVVGEPKPFVTKHAFTGKGLATGQVPGYTSRLVAHQLHQAVRYVNTSEYRNLVRKTGSASRRTSRDVLIRIPDENLETRMVNGRKVRVPFPKTLDEALGKGTVTTDEIAGHESAYTDHLKRMIPGLHDNFSTDRVQAIGTPAPKGYRWVDKNVLGDLARMPAGPRGRIARTADTINSAVTAATVYFKIGHLGTRALTNAATNIIQGSAAPTEIARSVTLWKALSPVDKARWLAAAGQHGMQAMPHEGVNLVAKAATTGANWWARRIDAPFRFNSLAYEARRIGVRTPEQARVFLDQLENPGRYPPEVAARADEAARLANREAIAYDRLNHTERQYITRAIWFYPWIKSASVFAARTFVEHPFKGAILGAAAGEGRRMQQQELGDLPSYEGGLFQLHGGARPAVADFSTFSPFSTPADVLGAVARPGELSGFLNPVYGGATQLAYGLNQQGGRSTTPVSDALQSVLAPMPESQILTAFLQRHQSQVNRMFPKSPGLLGTESPFLRALLGPGTPRRLNPAAARKAAARERSGR